MMMRRIFSILFIVFFSLTLKAQEEQVIDRIVAVVGQNIILQSDIEAQYLQYRLQGGFKGSASSIRCEILEDLMFQKLMLNQAEMDSITVTDEQVNSDVDRMISYFVSQVGSQENLAVRNSSSESVLLPLSPFLLQYHISAEDRSEIHPS